MKTTRFAALLLLLPLALPAFAQTETNQAALRAYAQQARILAEARKEEALFFAKLHGLPVRQALPNGKIIELVAFERGRPIYVQTDNVNAAISTRANRVHPGGAAGLNLTGSGVVLGIWDGGHPRSTHQEYVGRVVAGDTGSGADHASHVAGTMIATGVNASAKGMSYQATLNAFEWNSDSSEMATAAGNGLLISNHSYGYVAGWHPSGTWYWYGDLAVSTAEDNGFGIYEGNSVAWDSLAYDAPYYLPVKSAGNDRNQGPAPGTVHQHWDAVLGWVTASDTHNIDGNGTGYDTIPYNGVAKNILTVGAVADVLNYTGPGSVSMSSFSGWGPTDDGRIKPDIVGNGVSLTSSVNTSNTAYASFSGTSMSSPNVSGSLGLLVQHFRNTHSGADMRSATLKGLTIHTADEAGSNPGPDYAFGWGLMNTERAAQVITQDVARPETMQELVLNASGTQTLNVYSDGSQPLRATICWTDPAGAAQPWALNNPTSNLVNDLDLRVTGPSGTAMPWVLNPASPASAATTGDNFRDNVEQVLISAPTAGNYIITVSHKGVGLSPSGQQAFSLIVTGQTDEPSSAAELSNFTLSASTIGGGNNVTGTVTMTNTAGGTVNLSSSNTAVAAVPATVTVPAGSSSANFTINTSAVASTTNVTINASKGSVSIDRNLEVRAASLVSVSLNPTSVTGGSGSTGTVTVSGNIPSGGISIALSSDNSNAGVPSSVNVGQGQTTATFAVTTSSVTAIQTATITASFEGVNRTAALTINPEETTPTLTGLSLSPSTVTAGQSSTGTVTLSGPAGAGGVVVSLTDNSVVANTPSSVTVPQGATSANFTITTTSVNKKTTVTVTASLSGTTRTATLVVNKPSGKPGGGGGGGGGGRGNRS